MIIFQNGCDKTYNYIINRMLKLEIMNEYMEEQIEEIVPKFLVREQFQKCKQTFEDLFNWSKDNVPHYLDAFHEYILYYFLEYLDFIKTEDDIIEEDTINYFFDKKSHELIDHAAKEELKEIDSAEMLFSTKKEELEFLKSKYYNFHEYSDNLFRDLDFLTIDKIYNLYYEGNSRLINQLRINLDHHFELLPLDIQAKYKTAHITLSNEVFALVCYISDKLKNGSLNKLFHTNENMSQQQIQIIIDNLMTAYYSGWELEIFWKSKIIGPIIRFEIWKRFHENKKILFEIVRPSEIKLDKEFEKTLNDKAIKYQNAFFALLCINEEDYNLAQKFIDDFIWVRHENYVMQSYLNVEVYDARKRETASKLD